MNLDPKAILTFQIGGALTSAVGSYYAAQAQEYALQSQASTLQYQADIDKINAELTENQAQGTLRASQRREQSVLLKGAQVQSAQKTATAANGVDINSGSAVVNRATTAFMAKADAYTISENALREANALRMRKVGLQNDALLKRTGASALLSQADAIDPFANAFGSLMSSAGQVASSWYMMNKYGVAGSPFGNSGGPPLTAAERAEFNRPR